MLESGTGAAARGRTAGDTSSSTPTYTHTRINKKVNQSIHKFGFGHRWRDAGTDA